MQKFIALKLNICIVELNKTVTEFNPAVTEDSKVQSSADWMFLYLDRLNSIAFN